MRAIATALLILVSSSASAQDSSSSRRWSGAGGLHFGPPARASVALGVRRILEHTVATKERYRDIFVVIEPGIGGGRCSVGYADFGGNLGTGWTVRASALRRWRAASANYLGLEFSTHLLAMGPRLGVFRPVKPDAERLRLTADFSIGF